MAKKADKLNRKVYQEKLAELHFELVKMQYWIKDTGQKLVILFEGRDAAGKGGAVKTIHEPLNPRGCRVVALGTPSDKEKTQWYFQRYVEHCHGRRDRHLRPQSGTTAPASSTSWASAATMRQGVHARVPGIRAMLVDRGSRFSRTGSR